MKEEEFSSAGNAALSLCAESAVVPNCLSSLYAGLFIAGAIATYTQFKGGRFFVPCLLSASSGLVRCILFAIPQSYYVSHVHPYSGGSCALDLFPESLFFVTIWLFSVTAFVQLRREQLTHVADIIPGKKQSKHQSTARTPLISPRELVSTAARLERVQGINDSTANQEGNRHENTEMLRTRRFGVTIAIVIPLIALVVSIIVGFVVKNENYETVDTIVAVFRAVVSFAIFACFFVSLFAFSQHRVSIVACSLPIFLHGTFAAFDYELRMPIVTCRTQYVVWGCYFVFGELPLYILLLFIIAHYARSNMLKRITALYRHSINSLSSFSR